MLVATCEQWAYRPISPPPPPPPNILNLGPQYSKPSYGYAGGNMRTVGLQTNLPPPNILNLGPQYSKPSYGYAGGNMRTVGLQTNLLT